MCALPLLHGRGLIQDLPVFFELSVANADKGVLSRETIEARLGQFMPDVGRDVVLTREGLFIDKVRATGKGVKETKRRSLENKQRKKKCERIRKAVQNVFAPLVVLFLFLFLFVCMHLQSLTLSLPLPCLPYFFACLLCRSVFFFFLLGELLPPSPCSSDCFVPCLMSFLLLIAHVLILIHRFPLAVSLFFL